MLPKVTYKPRIAGRMIIIGIGYVLINAFSLPPICVSLIILVFDISCSWVCRTYSVCLFMCGNKTNAPCIYNSYFSGKKKHKNHKFCPWKGGDDFWNYGRGVYETTNEMTPLCLKLDWSVLFLTMSWAFCDFHRHCCGQFVHFLSSYLCSPMIPASCRFVYPCQRRIPNLQKTKTRVEKKRSKSRVCILFNLHFCCGQYSETHLEIYLCVMCMHIFSNNHCIPTSHHNPQQLRFFFGLKRIISLPWNCTLNVLPIPEKF